MVLGAATWQPALESPLCLVNNDLSGLLCSAWHLSPFYRLNSTSGTAVSLAEHLAASFAA